MSGPEQRGEVARATWILGLAAFLVASDSLVVAPLLPVIAREMGVGAVAAGAMIPAYLIPYGLCQLIMGPLGDRAGKLKVMRWATVAFAVAMATSGIAHTLPQLLLARVFAGAFAAAIIPLGIAYFGEMVPFAQRQAAIAAFLSFYTLGSGLSVLLGGAASTYLNWRLLFVLYGVAGLALAGVMQAAPPDTPTTARVTFRALFASRLMRVGLGAATVYGALLFGGFSFLGLYLDQQFSLSHLLVGLLLSPFGLAPMALKGLVPPVRRVVGERGLVIVGFGLMAAGFGLILASSRSLLLFGAGVGLLGLGYIAGHTMMLTLTTDVAPGAKGRATSLYVFFLFGAGGLGTEVLRHVLDRAGARAVVWLAAGGLLLLTLCIGPLLGWAMRRRELGDATRTGFGFLEPAERRTD